jgi:glycosyltransferase involved in cell wall biosynthesis
LEDRASFNELVSVVIGTYNAAHVIGETIDSVLAQTYQPMEIVVVDDGSTDGTWDVLQSYGDRISAHRQPNGGVAPARNTGLKHARGAYIALMDHDDLCEPERIAAQVKLLQSYPDVVLCSSDFSAFNKDGWIAGSYCAVYYSQCHASRGGVRARYPNAGTLDMGNGSVAAPGSADVASVYYGQVYDEIVLGNFVHPPTVMFRRSLLGTIGTFDSAARMMCDWDWLARAARVGSFAFIDRPLLRYRRSDTQISSARHQPKSSLDSLYVAQQIVVRDPLIYQRKALEFRQHLGIMCLDAADANAEVNSLQAGRLLFESIARYGTVQNQTYRTLLKIILPKSLLDWMRRLRQGRAVS